MMFWNRTGYDILPRWQADLSHCTEMGRAPVFYLGRSDAALDGLLGVQTLHHFVHHNRTITAPWVLMGGDSALWLYASLQSRPAPAAPNRNILNWTSGQPGTGVVFTGVDPATHMASIDSTYVPEPTLLSSGEMNESVPLLGLLRSMRWLYAPITEPAADAPWSAVPFLWSPAASVQNCAVDHPAIPRGEVSTAADSPAADASTQPIWLAWFIIFLVAIILLMALFG